MDKTYKTLRGGYETPECEVVNLICGGAVIMQSAGANIEDWLNDGRGTLPF